MADSKTKVLGRLNALRPNETPEDPRWVDLTAKIVTLFKAMPLSIAGWGVLCVLMLVVFGLCGRGGMGAGFKEALGKWEPYGQAKLVSVEGTGTKTNKKECLKLSFRGQTDDGTTFSGVSYGYDDFKQGSEVDIERLAGTTDVLHVKGASISRMGPLSSQLFLFIPFTLFFVCGCVLGIYYPIKEGLRALRFLTYGEYAIGTYQEFLPPPTDKNGEYVRGVPAQFVYGFVSKTDGAMTGNYKTMQPELYAELQKFPLLYLDDEPEDQDVMFYYDLPDGIYFDSDAGIRGRLFKVLPHFALIALTLVLFVATCATTMKFERAEFSIASAATTETAE